MNFDNTIDKTIIIGGGLAGSEAAWQLAKRGIQVELYEMRPEKPTGAHRTGNLAELVCSNSLGSNLPDRASGLLKQETKRLGSLLLECAVETALPAGNALAVDRNKFSEKVTEILSAHPNIKIIRQEVEQLPDGLCIVASGPLTSPALSQQIQLLTGQSHLFFFDAIAPIVTRSSINMEIAFTASRFQKGPEENGDYINCPFNQDEYYGFIDELIHAEKIELRAFEERIKSGVKAGAGMFFEGCLPVEILAGRGKNALAFGPLRPIGLYDPRTGRRPFAVLQLRRENLAGNLYNLVGLQTNLTYPEQKRVFHLIPGLENAEFVRFGEMHRNTYIASPLLLNPSLQFRARPNLFFAGQITGIEGYIANIASGLLAGINVARYLKNLPLLELPETTMLGALTRYITQASMDQFQPMKSNFGILPETDQRFSDKKEKNSFLVERALHNLEDYLSRMGES